MALARGRKLDVRFRHARGRGARGRDLGASPRAGRDAGHRRRVRLRQEPVDDEPDRVAGLQRPRHGLGALSTASELIGLPAARCADPRPAHRHDLPGPDDLAESVPDGVRADGPGAACTTRACRREGARARCVEMLEAVRIPDAAKRGSTVSARVLRRHAPARDDRLGDAVPAGAADRRRADHGARRHRAGADPRADARLRRDLGTAIILITHDLGVVAGLCDRVLVMHGGEEKEAGPVDDIFYRPQHAYTRALLAAVPRLDAGGSPPPRGPVVRAAARRADARGQGQRWRMPRRTAPP
jgi:hypothetical protein